MVTFKNLLQILLKCFDSQFFFHSHTKHQVTVWYSRPHKRKILKSSQSCFEFKSRNIIYQVNDVMTLILGNSIKFETK